MADLLPALPEDWDRCLAVAAHPDDIEEFSASAVGPRGARGKEGAFLVGARGGGGHGGMHPDEAATETGAAAGAVARDDRGGDGVGEFRDHRDGVIEGGPALRRDSVRAMRQHRPEVVISNAFSVRLIGGYTNQADHRVVGLAALDAARDTGNRWIFPELEDE